MKEQIQAAIADMSKKIARDNKHNYYNPETGEKYQGVSTVSSIVPKDWLSAWGAKEAVKALGYTDYEGDHELAKEVLYKLYTFYANSDIIGYIAFLKECKGASARKSKKALVDGKAGHKLLEDIVQARIDGKDIPSSYLATPLERPISQFLEWEAKEVDYWIASEAYVVRPDKMYAGQLDSIYMSKAGKLCLGDFKFASHISEDYYLQTGGYTAAFEPYNIKFDKRVIVRLPKTLEREEWVDFKYRMVPNDIEVQIVPTTYEADREAFFHALPLKGWINYVTSFEKK